MGNRRQVVMGEPPLPDMCDVYNGDVDYVNFKDDHNHEDDAKGKPIWETEDRR